MRQKISAVLAVCLCVVSISQAVTFNATFTDGAGETWTAERQAVINAALNEWAGLVTNNETIDVEFDFQNAGSTGYLGQWDMSMSYYNGDDIRPWYSNGPAGITHTIHFNADKFSGTNYLWWDATPTTADDQPFEAWDALSVARHEIGHLMGFNGSYVDNIRNPDEDKLWENLIVGDVFDPTGLNVAMTPGDEAHIAQGTHEDSDLMAPALVNNQRREISQTDLAMLQKAYYDYNVLIPEPATMLLVGCGLGMMLRRRKKA